MERIEKPVNYEKSSKIDFVFDIEPPFDILKVKNIDVAVGDGDSRKVLAGGVSFELKRGEKLAVVGANGSGKSTLLKMLTKKLPCFKGVIEWGRNTRISYFDQENTQLHKNLTVIEEIHTRYPTMTDLQIRSLLGLVRLTGENVFKPISVISGGERAKLCFAIMMLERGNVLILDEPTNHLDISTREVLEDALADFAGTVIFVSHDRYLLRKLSTRVCEITADGMSFYAGGFEEYQAVVAAASAAAENEAAFQKSIDKNAEKDTQKVGNAQDQADRESPGEDKKSSYRSKEQRAKDSQNRQFVRELEQQIEALHDKIDILQAEIADPSLDYEALSAKCNEIDALKTMADEKTNEWLTISEELEKQ
jgi:ATP-binding cassette subfamily F protein 3